MKKLKVVVIVWIISLFFLFSACRADSYEINQQLFAMDAPVRVQLYAKDQTTGEQALKELDERFQSLDKMLSKTNVSSDISALNLNPNGWIAVQQDTSIILQQSIAIADQTNGAFNPMLGAVSDLWNINEGNQNIPTGQAINKALQFSDYHSLIGPNGSEEYCLEGDAKLDLGAIGKGYAIDAAESILKDNHIDSALISMGSSSILAFGTKPDGNAWKVAIQNVDFNHGYFGILSLNNQFLSTSGDYEHYFIKDGIRYHHILDPQTGYPVRSGLRSVTIVGDNGALCDAYSTALFVMGLEKSLDFYDTQKNFEAIFVTDQKEVIVTEGLQEQFEFTGVELGYVYNQTNE